MSSEATSIGDSHNLGRIASLAAELGALLLLVYYFQLESPAFFRICALAFSGFTIHYFLPLRLRLPFFLVLSFAGIGMIFGWDSLWLVGIGLILIGLCHLPLSFRARMALLVVTGGVLAGLRAGWAPVPWSSAVWPILASMFMFRLIVYLHDTENDRKPASVWERLSYFFLLPNVCFPLFPVVDYKTFRRTYYNEERHRIYQTGVVWILRGLTQLILYRIVYYYFSMAPGEVEDVGDLTRYVVSGFLLYLRISGQFHIIVGMLRLFGFNLPESHHLYFLSRSFTDFWRRINIYWKDFMMKVFFYPMFFRLRKRGETTALVVSTAFVFFMTWCLHAYQWFWIRGSYLFVGTDILFWSILGVIVIGNTLYEAKHGTERLVGARAWTPGRLAGLVLRTGATFATICILWSLWTSASIAEWTSVWSTGLSQPTVSDWRLIPAAGLAVIGFCVAVVLSAIRDRTRVTQRAPSFTRSVSLVLSSVAAITLIGTPELYARHLLGPYARVTTEVLASTRELRLSGADADMLERGYYEDLLSVQTFNTQLWEAYASWPLNWSRIDDTGVLRATGDFLRLELVPSQEIRFRDAVLSTNRWGMRDREYELEAPEGAYRFALVGSSHVMGYGVNDDETFDAQLERRLNEGDAGAGLLFEVLNFGVDGYRPLQELRQLETKVLEFEPDAIMYVAHSGAALRATQHIADVVLAAVPVPYPELEEILAQSGARDGGDSAEIERRLRPYRNEILAWTYRRIVALCRERGVEPVWVYLPTAGETIPETTQEEFSRQAADAGFVTITLADAFKGHDPRTIWLSEWDHHPNAIGHQLIGDHLYRKLMEADAPGRAWRR